MEDELKKLQEDLAKANKALKAAEKKLQEETEARLKAEKHAKDADEMLVELQNQLTAKDMQVNGSLKIVGKHNTYVIKNPKGTVILHGNTYDLAKFTAEHETVLAELLRRKSAHVTLLETQTENPE